MWQIACVATTKAERWLCCWIVGELNGSEVGTKVSAVRVVVGVVFAAPNVVTHVSPLSGVLGQP
jgi:hypothetical protein